MKRSCNEAAPLPASTNVQPRIQAICLLPEFRVETEMREGFPLAYHALNESMMLSFADRFIETFAVTAEAGLHPIGWPAVESRCRPFELEAEERHVWLMKVAKQMEDANPMQHQIVCLVSGNDLRCLRRLGWNMQTPTAGMSVWHRRSWLTQMKPLSNLDVALRLFGHAMIAGSIDRKTGVPISEASATSS